MEKRGVLDGEKIPLLSEEEIIENAPPRCINSEAKVKAHRKCCKCAIFVNRMDGGYAWLITFVSFCVQLYVLGFMNNVSSLNGIWVNELNTTPGIISWIGSINMGMMFLSAPLAALMDKKLGCQVTGTIGCVLSVCGLLIASFSTNFVVLLISYGLIFGYGASCCFFSSILIQAKYFNKRLALSNGLVTAGSGAGTLLISAFASSFYDKFGWRIGIRYYSIGYVVLILIYMLYNDMVVNMKLCMPQKNHTKKEQLYIDPVIWMRSTATDLCPLYLLKNIPFLIFNMSCVFFMMGYFVPYIHLVFYAENKGIDHEKANFLIGYMAISSLCGKLITGKIAEFPCMSPLYLMIGSFSAIGLSHIAATMLQTYSQFIAYAVTFGVFDGAYSCLVTVVICDMLGREELGSGIGLLFAIKSVPLMLGGPFAGFLFDYSRSYFLPFLISGIIVYIAVYLMLMIPFYEFYQKKSVLKYVSISMDANTDSNIDIRHMVAHRSRKSEDFVGTSLRIGTHPQNPKSSSYSEFIATQIGSNNEELIEDYVMNFDQIQSDVPINRETFVSDDPHNSRDKYMPDISE